MQKLVLKCIIQNSIMLLTGGIALDKEKSLNEKYKAVDKADIIDEEKTEAKNDFSGIKNKGNHIFKKSQVQTVTESEERENETLDDEELQYNDAYEGAEADEFVNKDEEAVWDLGEEEQDAEPMEDFTADVEEIKEQYEEQNGQTEEKQQKAFVRESESQEFFFESEEEQVEEKNELLPKKTKKEKKPKEKKDKSNREKLKGKDIATIVVAVVAAISILLLALFKFAPDIFPNFDKNGVISGNDGGEKIEDVKKVVAARQGIAVKSLIQSDIPDLFYGFDISDKPVYYQFKDNKMVELAPTGKVAVSIDFGNQVVSSEIGYVELGGKKFGMGIYKAASDSQDNFYDFMAFKLVDLPSAYAQDGKALLLATPDKVALEHGDIIWSESFTLNLADGKVTRFLKDINRTLNEKGAGVETFCMLTKGGYESKTKTIPFFSSRKYGPDEKKHDLFIKNGTSENIAVSDVYRKNVYTTEDSVIFLKETASGFDVVKLKDGAETVICSKADSGAEYIFTDHYLFNVVDGKYTDVYTGEEKVLLGYKMTADMVKFSPDGKYIVMVGTVKSVLDIQIHIFNLETGDYYKYRDSNPSTHGNLAFINNTTAVYTVADPKNLNEYVAIDVTKAK